MPNAPSLTDAEKTFASAFLGRRSDVWIARLMKRSPALIGELRKALDIPTYKPPEKRLGDEPMEIILCQRCSVIKLIVPVDKAKQQGRLLCRYCRMEVFC